MVNHMLWNAVPYKNIVAALGEADYTVTERNISSWATGGYLDGHWPSSTSLRIVSTRITCWIFSVATTRKSFPKSASRPPLPASPPALPPIPTAHILAEQAREERHYAEIRRLEHVNAMMKAFTGKTAPATPTDRGPSTINDL